MRTEADIEIYGEKNWDDSKEDQVLTPLAEAKLTLKQALRDSKLGFNVSTQNLITLALELLGEVDEN